MSDPAALNESARHYAFLAAAWIANVDGAEVGAETDALCQLRKALNITPSVARQLHQLARRAVRIPPPSLSLA
jgi:hypothetical protein